MTDREKLVALLDEVTEKFRFDAWENTDKIADYLIANGVVVRKQPNGNRTKNRYDGSVAVVSISPDGTVTHYPSIKEAAKVIGTSTSFISQAVNFGKPCRGMVWKKAGEHDG